MEVALVLIDTRPGTSVVAHLLLVLKGGIDANMRTYGRTDGRNYALQPVAADGLRTLAPHFVLEPFIFGTLFEPKSEVVLSRRVERNVLEGIPKICSIGGIPDEGEVLI
jgi:hypothetical protein